MDTTAVGHRVRSSSDGGWLEAVGRFGLAGRGLIHGLVAWLALTVAHGHGHGGQRADSEGALATIAHQPLGRLLVLCVALGLAAYAVWSVATIARGDNNAFVAAGRAIVYALLAMVAFSFVLGPSGGGTGGSAGSSRAAGGGGGGKEADITAHLLHWPAGRVLVILIGLAVIAGGLANLWKIHNRKWAEGLELEQHAPTTQRILGALAGVGLVARAAAFALVGAFLIRAGWRYDPNEATGLDGALKRLAGTAHGPGLLTLVAIGLLAYGVWCVAMASIRPNGQA